MSRKERTIREWENRRNDIVDAAELLFFSNGYEHTTIDDIAKTAEFSKSTIYKYIKSKDELFLLVHIRGFKRRLFIIDSIRNIANSTKQLYIFGIKYYEFYKSYPEYLRLQLYWSVYGIDFKKVNNTIITEFKNINQNALKDIKKIFQKECYHSTYYEKINFEYIVSQFLQTLRTILNQSLFPVDPFLRFNKPDYYFRYLDLFMLSIKTLSLLGTDFEERLDLPEHFWKGSPLIDDIGTDTIVPQF